MVEYTWDDLFDANDKVREVLSKFSLPEQYVLEEYMGGWISKDQALVRLNKLKE